MKKISELPLAENVTDAIIPIVQDGVTKKIAADKIGGEEWVDITANQTDFLPGDTVRLLVASNGWMEDVEWGGATSYKYVSGYLPEEGSVFTFMVVFTINNAKIPGIDQAHLSYQDMRFKYQTSDYTYVPFGILKVERLKRDDE